MKIILALFSTNLLAPLAGSIILIAISALIAEALLESLLSERVVTSFIRWFLNAGYGTACLVIAAAIIVPNYLSFAFREEVLIDLGLSTPEALSRMAKLVTVARRHGYEALDRKNYLGAIEYFRKAAGQGDTFAQYHIGLIYHRGGGVPQGYGYVPQDYEQARHWYNLAAEHGHQEAKQALLELPVN